jgi:uncharacterized membrane protein YfcA
MTPDSFIPATLNVGHALPTMVQSAVFLVLLGVHVDPVLLVTCIAAAVAGAVVGAPLMVRAPVRVVQGVVGVALLIAAALYAMSNLDLMPIGGAAAALEPRLLWIAVAAHFVMGMLMAFGIGLYAPSLILLSLLGLDPRLAFPVMASACAFLMPTTGFRYIHTERIDLRIVIGIALGGIPAVLVAAFVVKEMPIEPLRWAVVAVVLYAAVLARHLLIGPVSLAWLFKAAPPFSKRRHLESRPALDRSTAIPGLGSGVRARGEGRRPAVSGGDPGRRRSHQP